MRACATGPEPAWFALLRQRFGFESLAAHRRSLLSSGHPKRTKLRVSCSRSRRPCSVCVPSPPGTGRQAASCGRPLRGRSRPANPGRRARPHRNACQLHDLTGQWTHLSRACPPDGRAPDGDAAVRVRAAARVPEPGGRLRGWPGRPDQWLPAQTVATDGAAWTGGQPAVCARLGALDRCRRGVVRPDHPGKRRQFKRWLDDYEATLREKARAGGDQASGDDQAPTAR